MASALVIVSKAVFEKLGAGADVGSVVPFDRYASTHKTLDVLGEGGALFLVTVRPPNEALWLVGILERPAKKQDGWYAKNTTPIRDITALAGNLAFANGKGLTAKPGALAMSLQTPRVLAEADVALLRGAKPAKAAIGTKPAQAAKSANATKPARTAKPAKPAKPAAASSTARAEANDLAALPPATSIDLAAIATALADHDAVAALDAALVAWRQTRAPALADLIDVIASKIEVTVIADEPSWSRIAHRRDAADVAGLLAAIPTVSVSFLPRAGEALSAYPDDPRIALATATWTHDPPTMSSSTHAFWTKLFDATARAADPRTLPILTKRLRMKPGGKSQFWGKLYGAIARVVPKIEARAIAAVDERAIAKLAKTAAKLAIAAPTRPAKIEKSSAPKLEGPLLGQALAHLEADRLPAAIDAMVTAWRDHGKQPQLADLIERATKLLPTWDTPLGATDKDVVAAWDAAFADDPQARMPQLLENLTVGGVNTSERHLLDLASLPDDPRIAWRLAALCCGHSAGPERTLYWKTLLEQLARIADPRMAGELCRVFKDFTGDYYDHHRQARRILGAWAQNPPAPPALGPDAVAAIAKIEAHVVKREAQRDTTERDLLNAIVDAWDDAGPRLVYADWLSDRQHPRGELIVLACKDPRTSAETKRMSQILGTTNLFGPFEELSAAYYATRKLALDRGLPTVLTLRWDTSALFWRSVLGYPLLATIAEIQLGDYGHSPDPRQFAQVLLDPTARRLANVTGVSPALGQLLAPHLAGKWKQSGKALVRA